MADEYAAHFVDELAAKPLDRALLGLFAELVRGRGLVADVGCGPGHVANFLHGCNVPVVGIDLSPAMVDAARRLHPDLTFQVGSMLALDAGDGAWGGIVAFYSGLVLVWWLDEKPARRLSVVLLRDDRNRAGGRGDDSGLRGFLLMGVRGGG